MYFVDKRIKGQIAERRREGKNIKYKCMDRQQVASREFLFYRGAIERLNANIQSTIVSIHDIRQAYFSKSRSTGIHHEKFYGVVEYLNDLEQDLVHITKNFLSRIVKNNKEERKELQKGSTTTTTTTPHFSYCLFSLSDFLSDFNLVFHLDLKDDVDTLNENGDDFAFPQKSRDMVMSQLLHCRASCTIVQSYCQVVPTLSSVLVCERNSTHRREILIQILEYLWQWFSNLYFFHSKMLYES